MPLTASAPWATTEPAAKATASKGDSPSAAFTALCTASSAPKEANSPISLPPRSVTASKCFASSSSSSCRSSAKASNTWPGSAPPGSFLTTCAIGAEAFSVSNASAKSRATERISERSETFSRPRSFSWPSSPSTSSSAAALKSATFFNGSGS